LTFSVKATRRPLRLRVPGRGRWAATRELALRGPVTRPSRQWEAARRRRALIKRSPVSLGTTHGRGSDTFTAVVPAGGVVVVTVVVGGWLMVVCVGALVVLVLAVLALVVLVLVLVVAKEVRWACSAVPFGATGASDTSISW
jgi:hypothetical protein